MAQNEFNATLSDAGLLISGAPLEPAITSQKPWKVAKIDSGRIMAFTESAGFDPERSDGFARCSADMLYDLIVGLNRRHWSGVILVDVGTARKRLFFNAGEFVFAGSDLMDDRLGEVIYRNALISLDQLTEYAVQVDRKMKFGQVLLRSGKYNNTDLWNALKAQTREILGSVFMLDQCYIEVQSGSPPIEVNFESGTLDLLESAYSFGAQFRYFLKRLNPDVRVFVTETGIAANEPQGTFIGDMLALVNDSSNLRGVVSKSKLSDLNTLVAVQKLVASGFLRLEGVSDPVTTKMDGSFGTLKSRVDSYQVLHSLIVPAFQRASVKFPVRELMDFALSLNHDGCAAIYLDKDATLPAESVGNMFQQCSINSHRRSYFQIRLESLTRYLLQLSGDLLPSDEARKIKAQYLEISS